MGFTKRWFKNEFEAKKKKKISPIHDGVPTLKEYRLTPKSPTRAQRHQNKLIRAFLQRKLKVKRAFLLFYTAIYKEF
jgi:hypothetical protein